MTSATESRLWHIVEEAAASVTDETGRFRKGEFTGALHASLTHDNLDPAVRDLVTVKSIQSLVRGFGERRSPKPRRRDGMFHPRGILKLGNGIWVWMEQATPTDLLEWGRLSTKNLVRVASAEFDRQGYVTERLNAFRVRPGLIHLGELERTVFGYLDGQEPIEAFEHPDE